MKRARDSVVATYVLHTQTDVRAKIILSVFARSFFPHIAFFPSLFLSISRDLCSICLFEMFLDLPFF